ncbi:MAG: 3-methyl-2-oxobutanoate dehydrogenase subunit beta, partial [Chloroflexi bacterium]|nr:3-methyl-2-oxobutanoate dehydrogenase subunit beta [Chloroflexota bacterium]
MAERVFIEANEAIGLGAVTAGCELFVGYPITPQNEIIEWFAKEMPKRGLTFIQSEA